MKPDYGKILLINCAGLYGFYAVVGIGSGAILALAFGSAGCICNGIRCFGAIRQAGVAAIYNTALASIFLSAGSHKYEPCNSKKE